VFGRTILRESTHSSDGILSVESTTVHCAEDLTPSSGHDSGHLPFDFLVTPVPRCVVLSLFLARSISVSLCNWRAAARREDF